MTDVQHTTGTPTTSTAITPGAYTIDPSHSAVGFAVRHLMIGRTRGRFGAFTGSVHIDDIPANSSVEVSIDLASIDTGDAKRDEHLRSADFLDVEHHPTAHFRSTSVDIAGDEGRLSGELTIRGTARPVVLDVAFDGTTVDPWGNERVAFSATAELDREEWGMTWNQTLETGGVLVGKRIRLELEVEAVRQQ